MSKQIEVELQAVYGSDRDVALSAWTSSTTNTKKKQKTDAEIEKLINYLADNKHSTPFESIIFRFWIKMPICADRQFMTHRIQSSSGMSGRYRTMPSEFLDVPPDVELILNKCYSESFIHSYNDICKQANDKYSNILKCLKDSEKNGQITNDDYKRTREFFRGMLPQNNMTERVSIMNLRAFANFIKLRNSPHAQPEIRAVAEKMLTLVKGCDSIILSIEALERNQWRI